MRKILLIFSLSVLAILLFACDKQTTLEITTVTNEIITTIPNTLTTTQNTTMLQTLETINFNFDDFLGEGSVQSPVVVNTTIEEQFSKAINFHALNNHLVYEEGIFVGENFFVLEDENSRGLILDGCTDFTLSIKGLTLGVFYIRISSVNANPVYLMVNVDEYQLDYSKNLKVLAIGNSFSIDGMEYLYKIADDYGVPNITLGNLYIPGASLAKHVDSITNNLNDYVYYKNTNNTWFYKDSSSTLLEGLLDEKWDVITIQQVSGLSGVDSYYNNDVDTIINYINDNKTNDGAKIAWHMTWAYQEGSTHPDFSRYSSNQATMYSQIVAAVQTNIVSRSDIEFVIPSGTAIQNLRTSYIGDTLTRDGYHLSLDKGRYTAGLTWFLQITGLSIDGLEYKPDNISFNDFYAIKEAVNNAVEYPFEITQSIYVAD